MDSAPSRKEFADLVIRTLRTKGESRTIVFDEEGFILHFAPETDKHGRFWLHNVYAEYCAAPHDTARTQLLSNLAQSSAMVDGEETWGEVRVSIMPRVRPRAYYEVTLPRLIREMAEEGGTAPKSPKSKAALYRPYASDLGVGIAIDRPSSIAEVTDLEPWKVTYDEALEVALANLRRASKDDFVELDPGVFQSPWRDHYDAERMLLVDKIRALATKGAPVAMIPNRHTLLVTGEDDAEGLSAMVTLAEETLREPRPLTGMAFVLRGDAWEPFEPAGDEGAAARLVQLRARELEQASAEQKDDLQARLEEAGEDLFVASVMGLQPKGAAEGDEAIGLCVWSSGVRSLLPKTPLVALNDMEGDGGQTIVPWAAAAQVVGHRMKRRHDLYPPRWEVETFPTKEEIAEMERIAPPLMPKELRDAPKAPARAAARADREAASESFAQGSAPNASGKGVAVVVVLAVVGAIVALLAMLFR